MGLPMEAALGLSGYVSSIACDRAGALVAITSSRGALTIVLDIASGRVVQTYRLDDVSGIVPTDVPGDSLASSGTGQVARLSSQGGDAALPTSTRWNWDNHAVFAGTLGG